MGRLAFDNTSGFVYEGRDDPIYPVWPNPVLSLATLIEKPGDLGKIPVSFESNPFGWVFREDSFDPVSKIRRGRLFKKLNQLGWEQMWVEAHPAIKSDERRGTNQIGLVMRPQLATFMECTALMQLPRRGEGLQFALGTSDSYSLWRIIQVEKTINGDVLVTLRAESAFNILPAIDESKISPLSQGAVRSAIDRVLNAAYKELPTSVVDQCRNAVTVIVSRWMYQETNSPKQIEQDLGHWIKAIDSHFREKKQPRVALCAALEIIRLLHPRGKDNELNRHDLRPISEDDATLAVHAVGFVLREIGWAKS